MIFERYFIAEQFDADRLNQKCQSIIENKVENDIFFKEIVLVIICLIKQNQN